jgi:hypothetical protein
VKIVLTANPHIIDKPNGIQSGFERVSGIIHKIVQIEVKTTGSSLDIQASTIASLNGIFSSKFWFILSNKIIPFLTTIQNKATIPIIHGKERGCPKSVNQKNTQIRERGIVIVTKKA